ncbi:unnamed protein product, partial [Vitis vinifera]
MADRHSGSGQTQRPPRPTPGSAFLRRLHDHAPNSTQFIGFLALIVSGCILLFLTGLTITATVIGLIFFTPLILLSSPIWVPAGTVLFLAAAGFLSMCGFGLAVLAGLSWIYKYFRGWNPPGSGRFDYARSRIADTASHVKDYAREYGGNPTAGIYPPSGSPSATRRRLRTLPLQLLCCLTVRPLSSYAEKESPCCLYSSAAAWAAPTATSERFSSGSPLYETCWKLGWLAWSTKPQASIRSGASHLRPSWRFQSRCWSRCRVLGYGGPWLRAVNGFIGREGGRRSSSNCAGYDWSTYKTQTLGRKALDHGFHLSCPAS